MDRVKRWEAPFDNDMFVLVWRAFKRLYPVKGQQIMKIEWAENVFDGNEEACGYTNFRPDGSIHILISGQLPVVHATEIFAHELAHVAAGADAEHGEAWEKAFDAIHAEYMNLIQKGVIENADQTGDCSGC